jgi:hypothetical protein
MSQIVYLVFSKRRPDGYVLGVFSTIEKAQAYLARWDLPRANLNTHIEPWSMDDDDWDLETVIAVA